MQKDANGALAITRNSKRSSGAPFPASVVGAADPGCRGSKPAMADSTKVSFHGPPIKR
jgi:hypothetical protein